MTIGNRIAGAAALGAAIVIGSGLSAPPAQAGYVVTLTQQGSDVVATGSGPVDLTGLAGPATGNSNNDQIRPDLGIIITGPVPSTTIDIYGGYTGPTSFGSSAFAFASSGSGDKVGIVAFEGELVLPADYVSGSALSNTSTYDNQTFASLGVMPGTYEWIWGSGADQNFTLVIGAAAVPEPSSLLLLALPLGLAIMLAARHRQAAHNADPRSA